MSGAAALVCLWTAAIPAAGQAGSPRTPAPSQQKGRLFPPQDLGLIEAPDRADWQHPDQIMDALQIADGAVVADVGAAGGWFTIQLARRVGPNGLVYAEDIQPVMIEALTRRMQQERLSNVRPVLGTVNDPRLPAPVDAALIVDAYREMEDPVALLRNLARSLKPQGRLGVVDFTPGGGGPGPDPSERVNPEEVIRAAEAAGFRLKSRESVPPFQFLLVFEKAPVPAQPRRP